MRLFFFTAFIIGLSASLLTVLWARYLQKYRLKGVINSGAIVKAAFAAGISAVPLCGLLASAAAFRLFQISDRDQKDEFVLVWVLLWGVTGAIPCIFRLSRSPG
jgi:hypothetical protein